MLKNNAKKYTSFCLWLYAFMFAPHAAASAVPNTLDSTCQAQLKEQYNPKRIAQLRVQLLTDTIQTAAPLPLEVTQNIVVSYLICKFTQTSTNTLGAAQHASVQSWSNALQYLKPTKMSTDGMLLTAFLNPHTPSEAYTARLYFEPDPINIVYRSPLMKYKATYNLQHLSYSKDNKTSNPLCVTYSESQDGDQGNLLHRSHDILSYILFSQDERSFATIHFNNIISPGHQTPLPITFFEQIVPDIQYPKELQ